MQVVIQVSPLSTLESSFEALNIKKFDGNFISCFYFSNYSTVFHFEFEICPPGFLVAFSVDPLYHQTSAQFDEGGAKGLLLNNLGVYGGCRVLFDSFEVPGQSKSCSSQNDTSVMVDLSFAKGNQDGILIPLVHVPAYTHLFLPLLVSVICVFSL